MATVHYLYDDDREVAADQPLDLTPYPHDDEIDAAPAPLAFEGLRESEEVFSRIVVIAALALVAWMAIGIACAHFAGRL